MNAARTGAAVALALAVSLGLVGSGRDPLGSDVFAAVPSGTPVFSNPLTFTNTFWPFTPGAVKAFTGHDGRDKLVVVDTYLEDTRTFDWNSGTVTTRVLREMEFIDGELLETSWNYFAQSDDGTVWYFGEVVDIFEDGVVVSHDGSWLVGAASVTDPPGTQTAPNPGLFMPANPQVGDEFRPEDVPGGPAELDTVRKVGKRVKTPAGRFEGCIEIRETFPGEDDFETKWYAPGVGVLGFKEKGASLTLVATTMRPQ